VQADVRSPVHPILFPGAGHRNPFSNRESDFRESDFNERPGIVKRGNPAGGHDIVNRGVFQRL